MKAVIVYHKYRALANGEYPIMIRIADRNKMKYRSTGISVLPKDWNEKTNTLKIKKPTNTGYAQYLERKTFLTSCLHKYEEIIEKSALQGRRLTIDQLISLVENPIEDTMTFHSFFEFRIKELKSNDDHGNAGNYQTVYNQVQKFHKGDMYFYDLDVSFLLKFKKKLLKEGKKGTTVSIYLRTIRALYNSAIKTGYASQSEYPFIDERILKDLDTKTKPRAIKTYELDAIKELNVEGDLLTAKLYFLFGYYVGGINFVDMARLKWTDINYDRIEYKRFKIRKKSPELVSIGINQNIREILNHFRKLTGIEKDNYIFPILYKHVHETEQQIYHRVRKVRKEVNFNLKIIAKDADIEAKLTTYVWRHTFASEAKNRLNANPLKTMEMMGQKNFESHKKYLDNFDHKDIDKISEAL